MEKRQNAQIYVFCHKTVPYGFRQDSLYSSLEVGTDCREQHPDAEYHDNSIADNISQLNPIFAELCGQWWIWKKTEEKMGLRGEPGIVGQTQYRRVLDLPEDFNFNELERCAITCRHLALGCSVAQQFCNCHSRKYLGELADIIKAHYPDYVEDWHRYIELDNKIYYSNGFILREDDYCNYSKWLFDILFKWVNGRSVAEIQDMVRADIKTGACVNNSAGRQGYFYAAQIPAFFSERLWTLWVRHNFENILEIPYTLKENSGI